MKFRVAMVGGALICSVVLAAAWVIRINHHPPVVSNASPQASSPSDRTISFPSRIESSGMEKVFSSTPQAVPNTRQSATINPPATLPNVQGSGRMLIGFDPKGLDPKGLDPAAWIRELPEGKKGEVKNAFEEHLACVRESTKKMIKATRGAQDKQIDVETMQRIWKDCDHGLKSTLRAVLSGEEYEQFLSSLPPASSANLHGSSSVSIAPK